MFTGSIMNLERKMYSVLKALYRGEFQYFRPFSLVPDETYTIEVSNSWDSPSVGPGGIKHYAEVLIYPPYFAPNKGGVMRKIYVTVEDLMMDWWVLDKPGKPSTY